MQHQKESLGEGACKPCNDINKLFKHCGHFDVVACINCSCIFECTLVSESCKMCIPVYGLLSIALGHILQLFC